MSWDILFEFATLAMSRQKTEKMENISMGLRCLGNVRARRIGYHVKVGPVYLAFPPLDGGKSPIPTTDTLDTRLSV